MATIRESRLATLLSWLQKSPLLLLTEEQIGAFLLGLVPFAGQLGKSDREDARAEGRRAMKPLLKRGEVIRLVFPNLSYHRDTDHIVMCPEGYAPSPEEVALYSHFAARSGMPSMIFGLDPDRPETVAKALSGLGDKLRSLEDPLGGSTHTDRYGREDTCSAITGSISVKTFAYASTAIAGGEGFAKKWTPYSTSDMPGETFASLLSYLHLRFGDDWQNGAREFGVTQSGLETLFLLYAYMLAEASSRGDCLISIFRAAELYPSITPPLSLFHLHFTEMYQTGLVGPIVPSASPTIPTDCRMVLHSGSLRHGAWKDIWTLLRAASSLGVPLILTHSGRRI